MSDPSIQKALKLVSELHVELIGLRDAAPTKPITHDNRPKLSKRDARDIRAAHRGGATQAALADSYDVNSATISRIVRGDYYA